MINKKSKNNTTIKKKSNNNTAQSKKRKKKLSLNDTSTLLALLTATIGIVCIKFLGIFFTLLLIGGIILIIFLSKLINRMSRKKLSRRIINTLVIIFLIMCIAGCIGAAGFFIYIVKQAPEFDIKKLTYSESTLVYDMNNKLIAELGTNKRENITYQDMSEV